jgi:MFS family permease
MNEISLKRTKKNARLALLTQYFLMGFIFSSLLSRFPALQEQYGLTIKQLSFVPFFMSVGSLLIMPFCGYLVGKYGCKRLSVTGYIYIGLFPLLTLMPNIYVLYLLCAVYGIFVSLTDISINANSILVERVYKKPIIGMFHAFFYVGMCSGALLSILVLFLNISVIYHLLFIASVSLIVFYFIRTFFLKETPAKINLSNRMKILFPKGILLLIAFIAFCGRIIEGSVSDWSTVYMKTIIDLSENVAPIGLAIYAAFIAFGRFFGDSIRKRYKESSILLGCCILTVIGLGILIAKAEIYYAIAGLFISGIGLSCLVPIIYSIAGNQKNISPGVGIAMVNTISGTGFLFGPFIIGLIADIYTMRISFAYVLLLTLIMTFLTIIFNVRKK